MTSIQGKPPPTPEETLKFTLISLTDPFHFDTDPDLYSWVHLRELMICVRSQKCNFFLCIYDFLAILVNFCMKFSQFWLP